MEPKATISLSRRQVIALLPNPIFTLPFCTSLHTNASLKALAYSEPRPSFLLPILLFGAAVGLKFLNSGFQPFHHAMIVKLERALPSVGA